MHYTDTQVHEIQQLCAILTVHIQLNGPEMKQSKGLSYFSLIHTKETLHAEDIRHSGIMKSATFRS